MLHLEVDDWGDVIVVETDDDGDYVRSRPVRSRRDVPPGLEDQYEELMEARREAERYGAECRATAANAWGGRFGDFNKGVAR